MGLIKELYAINSNSQSKRHPKCKGFMTKDVGWGSDFDCEYGANITCEECRYGICGGRKNPTAKCNQFK